MVLDEAFRSQPQLITKVLRWFVTQQKLTDSVSETCLHLFPSYPPYIELYLQEELQTSGTEVQMQLTLTERFLSFRPLAWCFHRMLPSKLQEHHVNKLGGKMPLSAPTKCDRMYHFPLSSHVLRTQVGKIPWRRNWQPTPVFVRGKSHGQKSLAG